MGVFLISYFMKGKKHKFLNEYEKNKLIKLIGNTDYNDENKVWDLALTLEHFSIVIRRNILEQDDK